MRRPRWLASIGALALAVTGLVTVGAGPGAAVLPTTISGRVVYPAGQVPIYFEATVSWQGGFVYAATSPAAGTFVATLPAGSVDATVSVTAQFDSWELGWGVDGWYVDRGAIGALGLRSQATTVTPVSGADVALDPITISRTDLTVRAVDGAGGDLGARLFEENPLIYLVGLVDPTSGSWVGLGDVGFPASVLPDVAYGVGVNRQSGVSRFTGRFFAGEGALGSPTLSGATTVTLPAGTAQTRTVRLDTCGTVSGTVSGGHGLSERRVTVFNDTDPDLVTRQSTIAADGSFEVTGLLPGKYWVVPMGYPHRANWIEGGFYQGADPTAGDPAPLTITDCSTHVTDVDLALPPDSGVVPVTPERVKDDPAVAPGAPRCVQVAGVGSVPLDASGVVLNVTTDRPSGAGYVVVYPDTAGNGATPPPAGSTVNFEPGQAVANSAFVQLPADGKVCYFTAGAPQVRVVLDVTGFLMPDSGVSTQASQRLLDTRGGSYRVGSITGPVAPRTVQTVQVAGVAGVPVGAAAVLLNVTVVGASGAGNLRVFPGGQAVPNASTINYAPGQTKASATVVSLPADGTVSFYSDSGAPVDVILDVVGSVAVSGSYHAVTPTRVVDTRPTSLIGDLVGPLAGRVMHEVDLFGAAGIPAEATAVVLNVTAIGPTGPGNLRVFPWQSSAIPPNASTLNYIPGRDIPNLVVVGMGSGGVVNFWSDTAGTVNLAADVVGYLTAPAAG